MISSFAGLFVCLFVFVNLPWFLHDYAFISLVSSVCVGYVPCLFCHFEQKIIKNMEGDRTTLSSDSDSNAAWSNQPFEVQQI